MKDPVKLECKDGRIRVVELSAGDGFYIKDSTPVKLGDKYKHYNSMISQIYYEPKKWWQFWKKKKQLGYLVTMM